MTSDLKICNKCFVPKFTDEYYSAPVRTKTRKKGEKRGRPSSKDGLMAHCKTCHYKMTRSNQVKDKKKTKEYIRGYMKKYRSKKKKL